MKSKQSNSKPIVKRVDALEVRVDTLHTSLAAFYGEFCDFRREMTFFKQDMLEFRADMLQFKADMLEFKDRTQTTLEYVVGMLETIHQEQLMVNAGFARLESIVGNHEGRIVRVEKHLGCAGAN